MWPTATMPSARGHVRQLRRARDDIADGVNARLAGALVRIHFDEAAVEFDFGAFETDVFGVGLAADGDQERLGLDVFTLAVGQSGLKLDPLPVF